MKLSPATNLQDVRLWHEIFRFLLDQPYGPGTPGYDLFTSVGLSNVDPVDPEGNYKFDLQAGINVQNGGYKNQRYQEMFIPNAGVVPDILSNSAFNLNYELRNYGITDFRGWWIHFVPSNKWGRIATHDAGSIFNIPVHIAMSYPLKDFDGTVIPLSGQQVDRLRNYNWSVWEMSYISYLAGLNYDWFDSYGFHEFGIGQSPIIEPRIKSPRLIKDITDQSWASCPMQMILSSGVDPSISNKAYPGMRAVKMQPAATNIWGFPIGPWQQDLTVYEFKRGLWWPLPSTHEHQPLPDALDSKHPDPLRRIYFKPSTPEKQMFQNYMWYGTFNDIMGGN